MIFAIADAPFVAYSEDAPAGLVGTIGVQIKDAHDVVAVARTTAGIVEVVAGSGVYQFDGTAPALPGPYVLIWDTGGATPSYATELFQVTPGSAIPWAYPDIAAVASQASARQRLVRGRAQTVSVTFGADGDALPDTATDVTVTLVDSLGGVALTAAAELVADTGGVDAGSVPAGTYRVAVPAGALAALDLLTAIWTATVAGAVEQIVTTIDVCDRRLFTLAQARAFPELSAGKYSDAQVEVERLAAEDFLEHECRCAFTGRYRVETHSPPFQTASPQPFDPTFTLQVTQSPSAIQTILLLDRPNVNAIRFITQDGVPFTDEQLATVSLDRSGFLQYPQGWQGETVIGYEHGAGRAGVNADAARACLVLARHRLLHGPLDDRAIGLPVEGGGVVALLTPGLRGSVTGIPEVDVFIARNSYRDNSV